MPKAAFCSECKRVVWMTDTGCENGHHMSCLRNVHEAESIAPAPASTVAPYSAVGASRGGYRQPAAPRDTTKDLGVVAIALGIAGAVLWVLGLAAAAGMSFYGGDVIGMVTGGLSQLALLVTVVLTVWLRVGIWRLGRARRSGSLLLASLVCLGLTALAVPLSLLSAITVSSSGQTLAGGLGLSSLVAGGILFAAGLLLTGLAPARVAWTGIAASTASAIGGFLSYAAQPWPAAAMPVVQGLGTVLECVFLVALGVSLMSTAIQPARA